MTLTPREQWAAAWRDSRAAVRPWDRCYPLGLRLRAQTRLNERDAHRRCRRCACTENHACEGGCGWASFDLCTACAPWPRARKVRDQLRTQVRLQMGLLSALSLSYEEDQTLTGIRVFKMDRWGRCLDSLIVDPHDGQADTDPGDDPDLERDEDEYACAREVILDEGDTSAGAGGLS